MTPDENDIVYLTNYRITYEGSLFERIANFLLGPTGVDFSGVTSVVSTLWTVYSIIAFLLSALFIYGIIYAYIRFNQLGEIQSEQLLEAERQWRERNSGSVLNRQWHDVQSHIASENPNDWKLSIIEADVMLDQMLTAGGMAGATVADKLRSASTRSFSTIDDAWQAHRVRNQIAHGGPDFVLTHKLARETITRYQKVFQEFDLV